MRVCVGERRKVETKDEDPFIPLRLHYPLSICESSNKNEGHNSSLIAIAVVFITTIIITS